MIQQNKVINTSALSNIKLGADLNLFPKARASGVSNVRTCFSGKVYPELIGAEKTKSDTHIFKILLLIMCSMHFVPHCN